MFGGQGIPMDIGKARAEGLCFKCGKPWPCTEHMKPRPNRMRMLNFKGVNICYQNDEELAGMMKAVEQRQVALAPVVNKDQSGFSTEA
jgi:hypothetical protein